MAFGRPLDELRYDLLFAAVAVGLALAWNEIAKAPAERLLLPVLCPAASPNEKPLRVIKKDGTLSNGMKLHGWRKVTFFGAHGGLVMIGTMASIVALSHVWPAKSKPNEDGAKPARKKPALTDDLA